MSYVWPGYVKRDDLVAFMHKRTPEIEKENQAIWEAMQNPKLSDEDYEALNDKYYMNLGRLREMRTITDWCSEHKVLEGV